MRKNTPFQHTSIISVLRVRTLIVNLSPRPLLLFSSLSSENLAFFSKPHFLALQSFH